MALRHGHATDGNESPTYKSWTMMKQRCENRNNPKYPSYGGRGITVCARWESFDAFLADMGERQVGFSIERLDNDGHYEPGNCVWASRKTQQRNRSTCKRVHYLGQEMKLLDVVALSNTTVPYATVYFRLAAGWDLLRALHQPLSHTGRPRKANPIRERTVL